MLVKRSRQANSQQRNSTIECEGGYEELEWPDLAKTQRKSQSSSLSGSLEKRSSKEISLAASSQQHTNETVSNSHEANRTVVNPDPNVNMEGGHGQGAKVEVEYDDTRIPPDLN
ncbi:hypothetical protein HAX54_045314 [Datura stramonium]|uniref:Uncharacterized protein n=1 Tax=Datura stramonium TaxID=4076 RepID=A0ABS8RPC4_DATST|nr:hypothetical protein [Datura stramonium]